ncbi:MAG: hypothetical protein JWM59_3487 [Verrucomicrobiales bacterium]|nr:hypothetical protein [Verrucomicrobiales bacterium]
MPIRPALTTLPWHCPAHVFTGKIRFKGVGTLPESISKACQA